MKRIFAEDFLTKGKVYEVIESDYIVDFFAVVDDVSRVYCYHKRRFGVVPSIDDVIKDKEKEKRTMNGFEALKLMQEGKKVCLASKPEIKYGLANGFIGIVDDRGCFVEDTLFNFRLDYEECIEPKPSTGWHDVGKSMDFFWIDGTDVDGDRYRFEDEYPDDNRFSTKEKAEEIAFKQTLFRKLQRFSDENGGLDIDWNDGSQTKWSIYYSYSFKTMVVDNYWQTREFGQVYFSSKEVAEEAVELLHDDLIKYFTHDWRVVE